MTNFLDRYKTKLSASGEKHRSDLELHDAKSIEAGNAVKVLATYSELYGPPSVWDVQEWIREKMGAFSARVSARIETIALYPEQNFVTFIVDQNKQRQPMVATATMTKAGPDTFLDNNSQLWEVVNAEQGSSYIVRKENTSIEEMLQVRHEALRGGASARKHVTLAAVDANPAAGGGFASMDLGDVVDFYHAGQIHRGKVNSAGANGVKITTLASGDTYTVDPGAVTSIVEKSAGADKQQDDIMRRYYQNVYPGNPEMTEIISPLATQPPKDDRPHAEELKPIEVAASTKVSGSARPFGKTSK